MRPEQSASPPAAASTTTDTSVSPTATTLPPSALKQLDAASMDAYQAAVATNRAGLPCRGPVIVNDFLNMTLYLCDGPKDPLFRMKSKSYFLMARSAHPTLAIYSVLAMQGFGRLTSETEQALRDYAALLAAAAAEVRSTPMDEQMRTRMLQLFDAAARYVDSIIRSNKADERGFRAYASRVRPLIKANLRVDAEEQLRQFRAQLDAWRTQYPKERWDELRVVVMGFHQARDLYVTKQLFRWLLREPSLENRVVYAEFQFSPFGSSSEAAKSLALDLLSKVDLDHRVGAAILGDRAALQRDVMGPAASDILKAWGAPNWP